MGEVLILPLAKGPDAPYGHISYSGWLVGRSTSHPSIFGHITSKKTQPGDPI